ncbi:signal transduction histidine kinase [Sphingopyxis panaciterrae]|uniref:sensor histidine kinase n=1 Tax=Sphingopyxis panaciterrae TaxID=363841 RepID=UPI001423A284|nr:ATP-binding protein [Sphingopyxis panaciterrae]NIJ37539.1 signal transduction histidine kinase [Sphingopyxis panaciterrae]
MLDLKTILVVTLATASLQAVVWIFVWRAWRHLYELKFLAAGFVAIAVGVLLMIMRQDQPAAWEIIFHNTIIKLGLVLLAEGLARFLGQPRYSWVGISLLIFQIIVWNSAVAEDPGNIAIRIHASTFFTVVLMSLMCLGLARDRTQPPLLRWTTIAVLAEYMAASIVQSIFELQLPASFQSAPILADRNSWYLLQGTLFLIALFACLLFMVSSRLSADLREKNEILSREVVERRRLESQLHASLETERALREEQADFMRIVSHEFRTPLAIIRNAAEMISLVGDKSPQATRERLAGIDEALNRLFSLIDRFMTNDRDHSFQPEAVRIGSIIAQVQTHFRMTNRGDRLDIAVDDPDIVFLADSEMMATVVINLVDNALKYSPADQSVHIMVRKESRWMVIEVRDRGMGIPDAESGKVGRRFFRASNAKAATGTGLGVYSARRFLAYHGGTLELAPNGEGGTAAIIHIPLPKGLPDRLPSEEVAA